MASPPFNPAITVPGDSDIASQYPAIERTFRDLMNSWMLINHNNLGQHIKIELSDSGFDRDPNDPAVITVYNFGQVLKVRLGPGGPVRKIDVLEPGTSMLFLQAAPPVGWNIDATYADRVVRVNGSAGGGIGGNWSMSGLTVDGHILTVAELASHQHDIWQPTFNEGQVNPVGGSHQSAILTTPTTNGSGPQGGNQPHTHPFSNSGGWRPAYADAVVGIKA